MSVANIAFAVWWLLCFAFLLMPLPDYDAHFFIAGFCVLCCGIVGAIALLPSRGELHFPASPLLFLMAAFWAVAGLSVVFSEIPFISYIFFCFFSVMPLALIFSFLQGDRDGYFKGVYIASLIAFAALSISTLVQYFFFHELLYNGRAHFPAADPNSLAGILSLGFFAFYALMVGKKDKLLNNLGLLGAALCFVALLSTGSRGAFVSLLVGVAVFVVIGRDIVRPHARCHGALVVLGLLGFMAVSYFKPEVASQTPYEILTKTVAGETSVLSDRVQVWQSTWKIIEQHFWTGIGVGTFFLYYPEFRTEVNTAGFMAHNDPLHFWAEMGVVAPILFYAIAIYFILKSFQAFKIAADDKGAFLRILLPFCALGALVLNTHITFLFYILPILFLIGTAMAFWFHEVEKLSPSRPVRLTGGRQIENFSVQLMMIVLVFCMAYPFVRLEGSEVLMRYSKERVQAGDLDGFVKFANQARDLSWNLNGRAEAYAATVPSGILRARKTLTQKEKIELIDEGRRLFEESIRLNPRLSSFYYELSVLSEKAKEEFPERYKDMPDPLELMRTAARLNPQHANTRVRFADLLEKRGDKVEAYQVMKDGLVWQKMDPNPLDYFRKLASMAQQNKDKETQELAIKRVIELTRGNQGAKAVPQNLGQYEDFLSTPGGK